MSYLKLKDLNNLRTCPILNNSEREIMLSELISYVSNADWFTVGIMAESLDNALSALRQVEGYFDWEEITFNLESFQKGPVFLKANQKTKSINWRIEHGLGVGILISCQHDNDRLESETFGPFPLDFFTYN